MALALSEEQLVKLNKKDILQLLLESMAQEKELRSQLAVLTDELKRTNQQKYIVPIFAQESAGYVRKCVRPVLFISTNKIILFQKKWELLWLLRDLMY